MRRQSSKTPVAISVGRLTAIATVAAALIVSPNLGRLLHGTATPSASSRGPAEETVYVTPAGAKYHRLDCPHVGKYPIALPLGQAVQRYAPCRTCNPPRLAL